MLALIILPIFVGLLFLTFFIVKQQSAAIVERFGKFEKNELESIDKRQVVNTNWLIGAIEAGFLMGNTRFVKKSI